MIADWAHEQQRCCLHENRNVLDRIPEKQRPRVLEDLRSIVTAPNESEARARIETLARSLQREYPKAKACVRDDVDRMVTFFHFRRRVGRVCARPIRSNRSSPQCGYELMRLDLYEPEHRRRTCSSSSFNDCRPAGAGSTATVLSPLEMHRLCEIISTPRRRRSMNVPEDRHELLWS